MGGGLVHNKPKQMAPQDLNKQFDECRKHCKAENSDLFSLQWENQCFCSKKNVDPFSSGPSEACRCANIKNKGANVNCIYTADPGKTNNGWEQLKTCKHANSILREKLGR